MRLLMRFMRPYRGLIAVTLLVLLIDNVGTLLVPTMLANMVNTGITTGDVDYILRNGLYMLIATGMASGGAGLLSFGPSGGQCGLRHPQRRLR
jgi:ATP-binding cassette subfamily B multidrug efflux pump